LRKLKYFIVGVVVGIPLFASAFFAAGFGHGTYLLFALFLGTCYFIPGALIALPALFGLYALIALRLQTSGRMAIASAVIFVHWLGAAAAIWYVVRDEEGLTYFWKVWPHYSAIISVGVIGFLLAHWLFLHAARRAAPAEISLGREA